MVVHMARIVEQIKQGRHSRAVAPLKLSLIGPAEAGHDIALMLVYRQGKCQHIQRFLRLLVKG